MDYLMHKKTFKYLFRKRGKNGKWQYVYEKNINKGTNKLTKAANKGISKIKSKYNKLTRDNIYLTNPNDYKKKSKQIKQTSEWNQIKKSNNPEYVSVNKTTGKKEYKFDDYLTKKKHPILDAVDDIASGRPISTNKITAASTIAGANDFVMRGAVIVGGISKALLESTKVTQGSYSDDASNASKQMNQGMSMVQKLLKSYR